MSQILSEADVPEGADIVWSVVYEDRHGDEVQANYTTEKEAQEANWTALSVNPDAIYGISVINPHQEGRVSIDEAVFIMMTERVVPVYEELDELDVTADEAREIFVGV